MKNPCAMDVVVASSVLTFNPPENNTPTRPAAAVAPSIWTMMRSAARKIVMEPMRHIPKVIFKVSVVPVTGKENLQPG